MVRSDCAIVIAVLPLTGLAATTSGQEPEHEWTDTGQTRIEYVETEELRLLAAEHAATLGPNGLLPGWFIIEEDIAVPPDYFRVRAPYQSNLWTGGVVPFQFDPNLSGSDNAARRQICLDMMQQWANAASLTFRPRTSSDGQFIHFRDSSNDEAPRNNSPIGPQIFGNTINIFSWDFPFVTAHEIAHSLGCYHEQSRPDRDQFIIVHWDRIHDDREFNFWTSGTPYGPYDYESLMHYEQCAFSTCNNCPVDPQTCRTITTLDAGMQSVIGQRDRISEWDGRIMSYLYPPSNWRFVDTTYTGLFENGRFVEPWKTVTRGLDETPAGGTLVVMQPTTYEDRSVYSSPLIIRAPLGGVVLR